MAVVAVGPFAIGVKYSVVVLCKSVLGDDGRGGALGFGT